MFVELLVFVAAVVAARIVYYRSKYDLHKLPTPKGIPLLGQTLECADAIANGGDENKLNARWFSELGFPPIIRVSILGRTFVAIRDNETIKKVVLSRTKAFPKWIGSIKPLKLLVGNDGATPLFAALTVTERAKATRKVYASGFQQSSLKRALPKLEGVVQKFIDVVERDREHGPIDFQKLFVRLTLDVIGAVAYEMNFGGIDGSRPIYRLMIEVGHIASQRFFNPLKALMYKLFPSLEGARAQTATVERLTGEWDAITKEMLGRADPPEGQHPFWAELRSMKDPETKQSISFSELRAEVATSVVAGTDTTGHQMAWLLAHLASNPRVIHEILAELKEHGLYGDGARPVEVDDFAALTYLSAVVKEGMRLCSVLPTLLIRSVPEDMTIMGYRVPKDTLIVIPSNRMMDCEADWGDPRVFRPERWLEEKDLSGNYLQGFSYGPKDCTGQKLAMLEIRMVILKLITRYDFTPVTHADVLMANTVSGVVVESKMGMKLHVKPKVTVG